jgi:GAF domain-containing protein
VLRSREALIVADVAAAASDFLDANILHTSGFGSALVLPLVCKGRAVGTLNMVQRARNAYGVEHVKALQPIADIFAVAVFAQQLQVSLGKYRSMETMSELTLLTSAEINSALQTIVGHCDLLERLYPDPGLQRDLATVVRQAQRIEELLARMRAAADQRMKEVEAAVSQASAPADREGLSGETSSAV